MLTLILNVVFDDDVPYILKDAQLFASAKEGALNKKLY
ncbi:MAG: hypothetical protein JWR67_1501 [Mucilaginibacter sp.]|nr:hypothetical protein [Mucilaginibacter sp.]MDB5110387.1 hypothetical protein [Mucilaginibacter sp.]